ncbi:MAG: single-stranded DNA-binding protein [Nitrososphaerales archaeon]
MSDINSTIIVGRLTRDIELKYTTRGTAIGKMGIAVNESVKKNEVWENEVSFFNITIIGKMAESLRPYLLKGTQIGIQGKLKQNRWEQNGQTKSSIDIIATSIQLLSSKGKAASNEGKQQENNINAGYEDDIPF